MATRIIELGGDRCHEPRGQYLRDDHVAVAGLPAGVSQPERVLERFGVAEVEPSLYMRAAPLRTDRARKPGACDGRRRRSPHSVGSGPVKPLAERVVS